MPGQMIFDETMSGYFSPISHEPRHGYRMGKSNNHFIRGDFRININNIDEFVNNPSLAIRRDILDFCARVLANRAAHES